MGIAIDPIPCLPQVLGGSYLQIELDAHNICDAVGKELSRLRRPSIRNESGRSPIGGKGRHFLGAFEPI
jgi:hypothetical protein